MKPRSSPLFVLLLVSFLSSTLDLSPIAQTREVARQQAESQLQTMTPQQVEAKIKEYGMTRDQAEAKAKELGIDLNAYLEQRGKTTETPSVEQSVPVDAEPIQVQQSKADATAKPVPTLYGLPYFGYEIFRGVPAAFEPTAAGPVDPEYIIGPGDVLKVSVWGQVELQNELTVDKEGRIFIPTVGQVLVSGQSLDATAAKLKLQMSRSYSGLVSRPPTVWMDLTISKLRPKRLFMMGEVAKPGGYTVSSYATVFNSLYSIGGPTVRGSLRDVRVIRGEKVIAHVDLYRYFTGADETNDIRVQNNDIIFVPTRGKTVSIDKEVRRPAVYELLPGEHLRQLLDYAGGALKTAYLERVQVDRIIAFKERTPGGPERRVSDVNFREILNQNRDYELVDGDQVSVYSILDQRMNVVTVSGAVVRPGRFQLERAPSVQTLIAAAEGLLPSVYTSVAHIIRYNDDWITRRIIPFNLSEILKDRQTDLKLQPKDEVVIYSTEAIEVKNKFVTVFGQVQNPGRYPLHANMTLDDLILLAGGFTESAELLQAEVSRVERDVLTGDSLAIISHPPLPKILAADGRSGMGDTISAAELTSRGYFVLKHRDEVLIRPDPDYKVQQNVTIEGDIGYPGVYSIQRRGERLSELLERAGGPTRTSYFGGAEFYRNGKRLLISFERAYFEKNPRHDVQMMDLDRIVIPRHSHTVEVIGEVNKPGLLSFIDGESVGNYIDRAGGLTDSANYAVLTKPTGESRRVNFGFLRADPEVLDGSSINVLRMPPPPPEDKGESLSTVIKDVFAILTAAATITFIVYQTTK